MIGILRPKRWWLIAAGAFFAIGILLWATTGYHTWEFKGGEGIRDSGYFSYPRYHARLGRFALWEPGEHVFSVRGMPPDSLYLLLPVVDATRGDKLRTLSTFLNATVTDDSGKVLCLASGQLSDAQTTGISSWVLSTGSEEYFWHPACREFPISPSRAYVVRVVISEVDPRSPHRMMVVVLAGGGHELP